MGNFNGSGSSSMSNLAEAKSQSHLAKLEAKTLRKGYIFGPGRFYRDLNKEERETTRQRWIDIARGGLTEADFEGIPASYIDAMYPDMTTYGPHSAEIIRVATFMQNLITMSLQANPTNTILNKALSDFINYYDPSVNEGRGNKKAFYRAKAVLMGTDMVRGNLLWQFGSKFKGTLKTRAKNHSWATGMRLAHMCHNIGIIPVFGELNFQYGMHQVFAAISCKDLEGTTAVSYDKSYTYSHEDALELLRAFRRLEKGVEKFLTA
jgi:hypothetical protein